MTRPSRGKDHTYASSLPIRIRSNILSLDSYRSKIASSNMHPRLPIAASDASSHGPTRKELRRLSATSAESAITARLSPICCLDWHSPVEAIHYRTSETARKSCGHPRFRDSSVMARLLLDNIRSIYRTSVSQWPQPVGGSTMTERF